MPKTAGTTVRFQSTADYASLDLRNTRQHKGVSLEDIADQTKISIRFLRAIEAESFDQLPGGIFALSYLRQYAAATGFPEAVLLDHYRSKADLSDEVQQEERSSPVRPSLFRLFWRTSAAAGR